MPFAARRLHPTGFVAPMLATLARTVPNGPQWAQDISVPIPKFVFKSTTLAALRLAKGEFRWRPRRHCARFPRRNCRWYRIAFGDPIGSRAP